MGALWMKYIVHFFIQSCFIYNQILVFLVTIIYSCKFYTSHSEQSLMETRLFSLMYANQAGMAAGRPQDVNRCNDKKDVSKVTVYSNKYPKLM